MRSKKIVSHKTVVEASIDMDELYIILADHVARNHHIRKPHILGKRELWESNVVATVSFDQKDGEITARIRLIEDHLSADKPG